MQLCLQTIARSSSQVIPLHSYYSSSTESSNQHQTPNFRRGDKIQVEILRFGPLGATVDIIAHKSHSEEDIIADDEPALGCGLIYQQEITYFRDSRNGLDVVIGEILPAYIENIRDFDGKIDISFRIPGGKGKAQELAKQVLDACRDSPNGVIEVGDKSSPSEINQMFPGASKAQFKRAVAFLYKKKLVKPGPKSTCLNSEG